MREMARTISPAVGRTEAGGPAGGMVAALLCELGELLAHFLDTGEHGTVDLLNLPMSPTDLHRLKDRLGHGEVSIVVKAAGNSEIYETAYAGLWWVQHQDESGRVVARLIEAADVPDMVPADRKDLEATADALTRRPFREEDA